MALVDWHQVAVIHHHLRCSILHRDEGGSGSSELSAQTEKVLTLIP